MTLSAATLMLSIMLGADAGADQPPKATLTVGQIYTAAASVHGKIKNVRVRYELRYKKLLELPGHTANKISLSTDAKIIEFALDGERRKLFRAPLGGSDPGAADGLARTIIFDGSRSIKYGDEDIAEVSSGKAVHADDLEFYTDMVLGIPVTDGDRAQFDNGWYYPHCLRRVPGSPGYHVRPDLEAVDGAWCHVVYATGYDTLWVDPTIGYAVRRREQYYGPDTGALINVDAASDFVEGFSGVWVPTRFRRLQYAELFNPPEYYNKPYLQTDMQVLDIGINKVTDADFEARLKAGRYVLDNTNGNVYQVPGSELDALRDLAATGERYVVDVDRSTSRRVGGLGLSVRQLALVAASLLTIVIVVIVLYRRSRQPPIE